MSPAEQLLIAYLDWRLLFLALFFSWWAIWFTLGRNFSRTGLLCLLAKSTSFLAALGLLASNAFHGNALASSIHPTAVDGFRLPICPCFPRIGIARFTARYAKRTPEMGLEQI